MLLTNLPLLHSGVIDHVQARSGQDMVARRLSELGFVPGEPVRVVALGPVGHDPMAVEIGFTRFALRRAEAERIVLRQTAAMPAPPTLEAAA
ncbi:MAG: FeoA family protein [Acetobacter sp.]|uniref:FeoA family protein n=1 Tax=Acetobacter sp. TaxID=440 RepID=UPI0039E7F23A